jgi:hypothetical protein
LHGVCNCEEQLGDSEAGSKLIARLDVPQEKIYVVLVAVNEQRVASLRDVEIR